MNRLLTIVTFTVLFALLLIVPRGVSAQLLEQTIELSPGWNAIYVRLDPEVSDIEEVFAGLPVRSVWRYIPDDRGAEFVSDPAEGLQNLEGWFGWFPEPRPEAFLSNLFTISPNTAYLVELDGTESQQITISGRPEFRSLRWRSNGYTLTGLPVSEQMAPTFSEFFEFSAAHQAQPIYALSSDGRWSTVSPSSTGVDSDSSYWIFTNGNSTYQGATELVLDQGESLEYARVSDSFQIVLRNRTDMTGTFLIERLNGQTLPMRYEIEDPETGETAWPDLQQTLVQTVEAGAEVFLNLGVRRSEMTDDQMEQMLSITDEHGGQILLYASANTLQPFVAPTRSSRNNGTSPALAGLWSAAVQIDAVSESQLAGTEPTAVGQPFEQRFLIHVDSGGQAKLLKDVILMWEDGTLVPSDEDPNFQEVEIPGRYVLITNKQLIPLYAGSVNRDGQSVGQRVSTVAYDFEGEYLEMGGAFGPGSRSTVTLTMEPEFPTNPFRHKFHPDHDNKDAQFISFQQEAFQVIREMTLDFAIDDPLGLDPPGWGSTLLGGTFEEALTGLHKNTIFVSGSFRMRRISNVPVLNQ